MKFTMKGSGHNFLRQGSGRRAFTLIEMLVVIAIIGVLAALVTGVASGAARSRKVKRVESDLARLVTAIEDYKAAIGTYPPDNFVIVNGVGVVRPSGLYYELVGTEYQDTPGVFVTLGGVNQIAPAQAQNYFGRKGFQNSVPGEAQSFLTDIRNDQKAMLTSSQGDLRSEVIVLTVPVVPDKKEKDQIVNQPLEKLLKDGSAVVPDKDGQVVYQWKYVSSAPTNNTASFDLWAEVKIGDEIVVISNWQN